MPNSILKNMPNRFHNMLFLFFSQCYRQQSIPLSWKNNNTILLYKKRPPFHLPNHRPIALANTTYKLFTSTLTTYSPLLAKNFKSYTIVKKDFVRSDVQAAKSKP